MVSTLSQGRAHWPAGADNKYMSAIDHLELRVFTLVNQTAPVDGGKYFRYVLVWTIDPRSSSITRSAIRSRKK